VARETYGPQQIWFISQQISSRLQGEVDRRPPPKGEQLLGTSDVQSLADMENSYDAVRHMRLVPLGLSEVTALAVLTLAPLLPLTLTVYSLDQLVSRAPKMMF
jgi:hypothetical protein